VDILVEFHLVEDSGFSGIIETEHENLGLHVGKGCEEFCDVASHLFIWLNLVY
jgi:hypothetical protein